MSSNNTRKYTELNPRKELKDFVASYWESTNDTDHIQEVTICPDGYVKLIFQLQEGRLVRYIMTGLWTKEVEIKIPSGITSYGIRLKVIAPEYILKQDAISSFNSVVPLNFDFLDIKNMNFTSFEGVVEQLETTFLKRLASHKEIRGNRLRLSQLLYNTFGDILASEVANQIYWSQREINRYLNRYLGISLKKYLNIQKCYRAYLEIREGDFFPEKGFFDQAHFIREVKKHTGHTPTTLHQGLNDQFIQLKNIKKL
ncbi:DUF6597 domain-containing transcriptional factor [Aquimarina algiphila]|uniref:DUF6597 domain-containing transcriptional factor n=1 Tax=Aquimarina algiphila TaxID=2047982 RepID=UPI00232AC0AC|nr:DUF6597 domain-containing transcriptional factor [Aquimarina algiphila]